LFDAFYKPNQRIAFNFSVIVNKIMNVNIFKSRDNQERNYVTTRSSKEDVDKSHYEFVCEMPPDFESEDTGREDDSLRLGEYTKDELIKKIETYPGYAQSINVFKKINETPALPAE
jgi:hypothetical protein